MSYIRQIENKVKQLDNWCNDKYDRVLYRLYMKGLVSDNMGEQIAWRESKFSHLPISKSYQIVSDNLVNVPPILDANIWLKFKSGEIITVNVLDVTTTWELINDRSGNYYIYKNGEVVYEYLAKNVTDKPVYKDDRDVNIVSDKKDDLVYGKNFSL